MRNILLSTLRSWVRHTRLGALPTRLSDLCVALKPSLARRHAPPGASRGAIMPLVIEDPRVAGALDQIPSETTKAERRFLYHFFRGFWSGRKDVLEIGPFLGGTTRAIAMGMAENRNRAPGVRLRTYDRFRHYGAGQYLMDFLAPLFAKGILDEADRRAIAETSDFEAVFRRLHRDQPYAELIDCVNGALPDLPEDVGAIDHPFAVAPGAAVDAVFVDGCKSWFGTRFFMETVLPHAEPGAWFLFQDYGQHTCFWLPCFLDTFADAFTLRLYRDATYAFQLERPLRADELAARFPARPDEWTERQFETLFARLLQQAGTRDDHRARIVYTVQWAAAMAYVGNKERARRILLDLRRAPWSEGSDALIRTALKSPTYRPSPTGSQPIFLDD